MKEQLRRLNDAFAAHFGIRAVRTGRLYAWQMEPGGGGTPGSLSLPLGAREWLRPDNPELLKLARRYAAFDPRVTVPARWTSDRLSARDLLHFRGDNEFLWQVRGPNRNPLAYGLCYYHFAASDAEGLLARLDEDALFGAHLFELDGRPVSRDLIDSAREIQFLQRHLGLGAKPATLLDIGAGYGRLAWRIDQAFGGTVRTFATDAFAPSTFVCDYYLRFRGAKGAASLPLDEVETLLAREPVDLAVNVHSFSECTAEAVDWWVERLSRHKVRHLFVVPNGGDEGGRVCRGPTGTSIEPIFERHGYRPVAREPRYSDPFVQAHGIDPIWLHLFELA
jgi:hypothetical protein